MSESNGLPKKHISFDPVKKTILIIALATVSVASAGITGWMIGRSGLNHTVIAAILPAILSVVWGVILFRFATTDTKKPDMNLLVIMMAILLFILSLQNAIVRGYNQKVEADKKLADELAKLQPRYDIHYFEACSNLEHQVNTIRHTLELPLLKSELFCHK